jgi:hypothetical protein
MGRQLCPSRELLWKSFHISQGGPVDSHFMSRIEARHIKIQFCSIQGKENLNKDILK